MHQLTYSPKSLNDLENMKHNITNAHSIDTAKRILRNMINEIRMLEKFPYSGRELSSIIDEQTDYRYLFIEKNYIFYRIDEDTVRVIRILNEKQDFIHILFGISNVSHEDEKY